MRRPASDITRRLAYAILRRYPDAWRKRYEVEVRTLVDDVPVRWRDVGELFHGMLTERARELVSSNDHPKRTATVLALMNPLVGLCVLAAAAGTGLALRALTWPWANAAQNGAWVVLFALLLTLTLIMGRAYSKPTPDLPRTAVVSPDAAVRLLPLLFVIAMLYFAISPPVSSGVESGRPAWLAVALSAFSWWAIAVQLTSSLLPGQRLLHAFAAVAVAENHLSMNQQWVAGCREMIAKGVPSPLEDALAQVGRWTVERDLARERLHELGYQARFGEAHTPRN